MDKLTMGSLFSGSGGFELAALMNGITPIWASEIEPFPIRVTTKRLPFVKHYGDISRMDGVKIEPVDIITFGSPCQNLSVAGRRDGLVGKQSSLFFQAIRIIKEMRTATYGQYPRYIVWENVPGAYSSASGRDFRQVLTEIIQIKNEALDVPMPENSKWLRAGEILGDGFSVAWRTLDAQHWGVAQRRCRCYLVADFAGECAGKILFESEGVSGHSTPGFVQRQATAGDSKDRVGSAVAFEPGAASRLGGRCWENLCNTLRTDAGDNQQAVVYGIGSYDSEGMKSSNPHAGFYEAATARTLDQGGANPACHQGGMAVIAFAQNQRNEVRDLKGQTGALAASPGAKQQTYVLQDSMNNISRGVAAPIMTRDYKSQQVANDVKTASGKEIFGTLAANVGAKLWLGNQEAFSGDYHIMEAKYLIRRLLPQECAVLQGFPANWCANLSTPIPSDVEIDWWAEVFENYRRAVGTAKKPKSRNQIRKWLADPYSDAAEYKLWGNGVALPCVCFVLAGIVWASGVEMIS